MSVENENTSMTELNNNDTTVTEKPTQEDVIDTENTYEPSPEIKKYVDEVYAEYRLLIVSLNINQNNFILVVIKTLERVEKLRKMSGQEKYATAILILDRLVGEIPNTDETDKYYLRNLIPSLIEVVIDASKGKLKLNLKKVKRSKQVDVKQVIDDLYGQIKDIIKNNHYTAEYIATNVTVIVGMLITAVEQYPDLTGMEKKAIVIKIIDNLIDDLVDLFPNIDPSLEQLINTAKLMLPNVIDMLISVGRNHFDINNEKCIKCFKGLFSCCKK